MTNSAQPPATKGSCKKATTNSMTKVRLDKWLWAARFFKTRSLAKQAIEGGKVRYEGVRSKVSKEVMIGATLDIRRGWDEKTVVVKLLSEIRRAAPQASLLYEETPESIVRRQQLAEQRRAQPRHNGESAGRPSKKARREIHRFKQQDLDK